MTIFRCVILHFRLQKPIRCYRTNLKETNMINSERKDFKAAEEEEVVMEASMLILTSLLEVIYFLFSYHNNSCCPCQMEEGLSRNFVSLFQFPNKKTSPELSIAAARHFLEKIGTLSWRK